MASHGGCVRQCEWPLSIALARERETHTHKVVQPIIGQRLFCKLSEYVPATKHFCLDQKHILSQNKDEMHCKLF